MKRSAALMGLAIALAWSLSSTLQGQELQEGTWSGSWARLGNSNQNPQPRSVSLEVKKIPDPHWRWRSGKSELLSVTFVAPQARAQASDLRLENGMLSYSFVNSQGDKMNCRLDLRKDGTYEGDCLGETGTPRFRLTLTPRTKDSK